MNLDKTLFKTCVGALALSSASTEALAQSKNCDNQIKVTYAEGSAQVDGGDLKVGDQLVPGTGTLRTGADGKIELTLSDGSLVRVGPNSEVKIDCWDDIEGSPVPFGQRVTLTLGKVWAKVVGLFPGEKFEVATETHSCGVRGTEFEVIATEFETKILVGEGEVEVDSGALVLGRCEAARGDGTTLEKIPPFESDNIDCSNPGSGDEGDGTSVFGCSAAGGAAGGGAVAGLGLAGALLARRRRRDGSDD